MTPQELKSFSDCLDQDHIECHKMQASGGPKAETVSSASGKALAAGISLKAIVAAILATLATGGGAQAVIAAILALLTAQPTP